MEVDTTRKAFLAGATMFGAWLTTRPYSLQIGASHESAPVVELLKMWEKDGSLDAQLRAYTREPVKA
jgi:hypothetical protein